MVVYYVCIWFVVVIFGVWLSVSSTPKKTSPDSETETGTGELVRRICYKAYKCMIKQHAPHLWRISACIGNMSGVNIQVAVFALEKTLSDLSGRYDCTPIETALFELKALASH